MASEYKLKDSVHSTKFTKEQGKEWGRQEPKSDTISPAPQISIYQKEKVNK